MIWRDVRYAVRSLLKARGFTAIVLAVLALGIGATTAIFSIANVALFRPLAFPEPDRIIQISDVQAQLGPTPASAPEFLDWRDRNDAFEAVSALARRETNLTGAGDPVSIIQGRVSADFFKVFGVVPEIGRTFAAEEDTPGANHVVVLSHGLWVDRFAGNRDVLGTTLSLDGDSYTVIGVAPAFATFQDDVRLWAPLAANPKMTRGTHFLRVFGRLKPGITLKQAQASVSTLAAALQEQNKNDHGVQLKGLSDVLFGNSRPALMVFLGAVGFVLLIAWANVANLQLARAASRQKEIALRVALGAGRWRLIRPLLTESLLLSMGGGALGIVIAIAGLPLMIASSPIRFTWIKTASLDQRVLLFTVGVSVVTGLVFGLAPALRASRPDLVEALKEGGRSLEASANNRLRKVLVVGELSLALVLLVGAGLAFKSFSRLMSVDPGFNPDHVLAMEINLPDRKYHEPQKQMDFFQRALSGIQNLPGVQSAGLINTLPLDGGSTNGDVNIQGHTYTSDDQPISEKYITSPDYFKSMGIRLIAGRRFDDRDSAKSPPVAIINERMAKQIWPDENPLGKKIQFQWMNNDWQEVVGVVADVRNDVLEAPAPLETYVPYTQVPLDGLVIAVRTRGNPIDLASAVRGEIRTLDDQQSISSITTLDDVVRGNASDHRASMFVLGLFSTLALILAAVGVYGVISYWVNQRVHEIGVRMALGASRADVVKLVTGQGAAMVAVGVCIGLVAAFALTRLMAGLLFGVSTTDPVTFAIIPAILMAIAILASLIPALRATRLDPMAVLRHE